MTNRKENNCMKLNYYLIQKVTNFGCLNRTQAELLGTPFPLRVGWIDTLEGLEISEDLYAKVMANRGMRPEILLHPNIPKPMHGVSPRAIMGDIWWNINRREAYRSTNFHCVACGIHKLDAKYHQWLEAHELYEMDYPNGRMIFKEVVPLCHSCHNFIHCGRMQILVDKGEMPESKQRDILKHGKTVMAGLKKPKPPTRCAEWSKWRLVFNGQEYKPKHLNLSEWMQFYNP